MRAGDERYVVRIPSPASGVIGIDVDATTIPELQELMNVAHEWLSAYERIMGHGKKVNSKKGR